MQAIQITATTAVEIAPAGNRDFLHIYNVSDADIYVSYDGQDATVAGGLPIPPKGAITLDNTGPRNIYNKRVTGIHNSSGNKEVRVQGV